MNSIEAIGLVNPIILLKHPNYKKYTILDGKSRVLALTQLFEQNHQDKYRFPLYYILDEESVDEYYLRTMILDLNFRYRDLPQSIFIKMLFLIDEKTVNKLTAKTLKSIF